MGLHGLHLTTVVAAAFVLAAPILTGCVDNLEPLPYVEPRAFTAVYQDSNGEIRVELAGPFQMLAADASHEQAWRLTVGRIGQGPLVQWLDPDFRSLRTDSWCLPSGHDCKYVTVGWHREGEPPLMGVGILHLYHLDTPPHIGARELPLELRLRGGEGRWVVDVPQEAALYSASPYIGGASLVFEDNLLFPSSILFANATAWSRLVQWDVGPPLGAPTGSAALLWATGREGRQGIFPGDEVPMWPGSSSAQESIQGLVRVSSEAAATLDAGGCIDSWASFYPTRHGGVAGVLPNSTSATFSARVRDVDGNAAIMWFYSVRDGMSGDVSWEFGWEQETDVAGSCAELTSAPWPSASFDQFKSLGTGLPVDGNWSIASWRLDVRSERIPVTTEVYRISTVPAWAEHQPGSHVLYNVEWDATHGRLARAVVHPDDLAQWDRPATSR